jgi:hypothetical protein
MPALLSSFSWRMFLGVYWWSCRPLGRDRIPRRAATSTEESRTAVTKYLSWPSACNRHILPRQSLVAGRVPVVVRQAIGDGRQPRALTPNSFRSPLSGSVEPSRNLVLNQAAHRICFVRDCENRSSPPELLPVAAGPVGIWGCARRPVRTISDRVGTRDAGASNGSTRRLLRACVINAPSRSARSQARRLWCA